MDGIGSSTDALLRRVAEDAGQTPEDHYKALGATYEQKKASFETDKTNGGAVKKIAELGAAKFVGATATAKLDAATDLAAAGATNWAPFLRFAGATNAISGTVGMAYELMTEGYLRPHQQGDALKSALANDAMMVGMSHALDMPEGFKTAMVQMRPEVATQGGAAIAAQFEGKDKSTVPILQSRADTGMTAAQVWAERIAAAPPGDRAKLLKDFNQSSVGRTAADDSAYGLGVAEAFWAAGARGTKSLPQADYSALFSQAHARLDAWRTPTQVQG